MTYTVLARCGNTHQVGVGITTASISFGGVGPICTLDGDIVVSQAYWNPAVGIDAAKMVTAGVAWETLLQELRARDPYLEYRQLGVVRADGRCHAHTGSSCRANAHHLLRQQADGSAVLVMGNGLCDREGMLQAMLRGFESGSDGPLAERLLRALEAGRDAGGQADAEGNHFAERSAKLRVLGWVGAQQPEPASGASAAPEIDLQVDSHPTAVDELRRLYATCSQVLPYNALRCLDPPATPTWGEWSEAAGVEGLLPPLLTPDPRL